MNAHNIRRIGLAHFGGRHLSEASNEPIRTGWPDGMCQDDDRSLSRWLSNTPGARLHATEAVAAIKSNECFTEEALLAADVANNADKAQSAAARNDDNAMRLQYQAQDVQDLINRRTA